MKIYISPMAGVTDYSYRKILQKFNPDLLFAEMVNAHLMYTKDKITINELLKCDDFSITGAQVFGYNKEEIINSFLTLENMGFKYLNLNMGCPKPKIVKTGAGSALLPNVEFIDNLLYELKCKLKSSTKLSIKIRIGYKNFNNPEKYIELSNKYNLDFICIHGRNQEQQYGGKANWDILHTLSNITRTTNFIGNGDLFDAHSIIETIKNINLDGIMLARGVVGNPWLITQIKEFYKDGKIKTNPTYDDVKLLLKEHFNLLVEHKGEIKGSLEINKFIKPYFDPYINIFNDELDQLLKEIIVEKNYNKKLQKINLL